MVLKCMVLKNSQGSSAQLYISQTRKRAENFTHPGHNHTRTLPDLTAASFPVPSHLLTTDLHHNRHYTFVLPVCTTALHDIYTACLLFVCWYIVYCLCFNVHRLLYNSVVIYVQYITAYRFSTTDIAYYTVARYCIIQIFEIYFIL